MTARQTFTFPPANAQFLIQRWRDLGCPEIALPRSRPGYTVTNLERFFDPDLAWSEEWTYDNFLELQGFLLDGAQYRGRLM